MGSTIFHSNPNAGILTLAGGALGLREANVKIKLEILNYAKRGQPLVNTLFLVG